MHTFLQGGLPSKDFSLISLANVIRAHLILSSMSFMNAASSVEPNISPWGSTLVTGCQFIYQQSYLPACLVFWASWSASSPPTAQTTCLDHNTPVSPGGGCESFEEIHVDHDHHSPYVSRACYFVIEGHQDCQACFALGESYSYLNDSYFKLLMVSLCFFL